MDRAPEGPGSAAAPAAFAYCAVTDALDTGGGADAGAGGPPTGSRSIAEAVAAGAVASRRYLQREDAGPEAFSDDLRASPQYRASHRGGAAAHTDLELREAFGALGMRDLASLNAPPAACR